MPIKPNVHLSILTLVAALVATGAIMISSCSHEYDSKKHQIDEWNELAWENKDKEPLEAIEYAAKALEQSEGIHYKKGKGDAYSRLGVVFKNNGAYPQALRYYFESQKIREEIGDENGTAGVYNNLGNIYRIQGDTFLAKSFFQRALGIYENLNSTKGQLRAYQNLGAITQESGKFDSALNYYEKILLLISDRDDYTSLVGNAYQNIGIINYELGKSEVAASNFSSALNIWKIENNKVRIAETLNNLGMLMASDEKYKVAISDYYLKSLQLAEALSYPALAANVSFNLANAYSSKGSPDTAVSYLKKYVSIKDSLYDLGTLNPVILEQLISKEELYRKNKEDSRNRLIAVLVISMLLVLVGYLFYVQSMLKAKRQTEKSQNKVEVLLKEQKAKSLQDWLAGQDLERKRISKELHNRLGNLLASVKLNLNAIEDPVKKLSDEHRFIYDTSVKLLNESIQKMRDISHDLDTETLNQSGIVPALEKVKATIESSQKIKVELDCSLVQGRLNTSLEVVIFDLVNELINNILKHAQATLITIQLIPSEKEFTLVVEDNGIGFDVAKAKKKKGLGLKLLAETVETMEGSLNIDSSVLGGTTIFVGLPLLPENTTT